MADVFEVVRVEVIAEGANCCWFHLNDTFDCLVGFMYEKVVDSIITNFIVKVMNLSTCEYVGLLGSVSTVAK